MTEAEANARNQHPSNVDADKKLKDLKKLSDSLEPLFTAVEAEVAQDGNEVLNEPFAIVHLMMTRDGVHRLIEVLRDGKSPRAVKYLLNMGQMIIHEIIDQSLYVVGDDDDET